MTDFREQEVARILVGESKAIRDVRREIVRYGPTKLPILIQGPTGSGKELVARSIHGVSRRDGTLVAFNVCALGDGMFEDALFGHVRGAFTGAAGDAPGYLAEANGGSVFLDEISGLSIPSQAKLLRALETGVFRPIGAARDRMSDFRLLSASNEDLATLARDRAFRADLLHRLGGCVLTLPALRDRRDDIPILARHFIAEAATDVSVSAGALERLRVHPWDGNIRELRHAIDRLLVLARGEEIGTTHVEAALGQRSAPASALPVDIFRRRLVAILEANEWDTAATASDLSVHRATVYRWMRRLQLDGRASSRSVRSVTEQGDTPQHGVHVR